MRLLALVWVRRLTVLIHGGKDAVTAQEERSEIVQRARLGNVDYNALQAQSQYATANGIDSGMGIQGQRKLLDNYKDIQDRIGQTLNEAKFDKKSGQWKGGDQGDSVSGEHCRI